MQQHGGADADGVALHGRDQRLGRLAEVLDEATGLVLALLLAAGLRSEIGEIVARRKAVAIALEHDDPNRRILLRALQPVRQGAVHGAAQRVLLVRPGQRQRHDPGCDFGLHIVSHSKTPRGERVSLQATFAGFAWPAPSRNPTSRSRMMRSASAMMRSINSFTVGTSLIRPATMPQLQAPASISPSIMTLG